MLLETVTSNLDISNNQASKEIDKGNLKYLLKDNLKLLLKKK